MNTPPSDTDPRMVTTLLGSELASDPGESPTPRLGARYVERDELLGEGGMGAVWAVDDPLIGRRVAMKVMRSNVASSPSHRAMFLREARVQGQLEHPAIVPVYDVGIDSTGAAFFTMKRVRGTTLARVLLALARGEPEVAARWNVRRLLAAFSNVCLAVDFAHQHGVVHRDLKPANLMLGDFGEVHVLDWGVARVLSDEARADAAIQLPDVPTPPTVGEAPEHTRAVGTPGYMAPEQIAGVRVGPAADVFALGAILYEILALRAFRDAPRSDHELIPVGALTPELAAICNRATAAAADRHPSARALSDEIEAYLDGERGLELRRRMAAGHLERARQLLATDPEARRDALREIGRALALEPDDPTALKALYAALAEAPTQVPDEVRREVAAAQAAQARITARTSALGYLSIVLFLPALAWIGVRDWRALGGFVAFALASAAVSYYATLQAQASTRRTLLILALSTVAFSLASTMYGPLVLVPTMIATNTMALALHMDGRARLVAMLIGCLGILLPLVLAALGGMPASYAFRGGELVIRPIMLELPALPTLLFLGATSAVTVLTGTRSAGQVRDALAIAEERLYAQRWQLRQLLPLEPRDR